MLEWLKTILGDTYSDELDKKVSEEIGKNFVKKVDFNTVNTTKKQLEEDLRTRDIQLADLNSNTGDVAELKTQIATLQTENANQASKYASEIKQAKIENAVDLALASVNARSTKAVKAFLDLEKAELDEAGAVKGLADQLKQLAEAEDTSFLFNQSDKKPNFKGFNPAESGDQTTAQGGIKPPKDMSYDELCTFLAENPNVSLE